MSFYIRQLKDIFKHISAGLFSAWWPVFSLVACFVLKIEQFEFQMFSQYVKSTLFLSNITGSPSSIYEYCRIQYIDFVYCYVI